MNFKGKWIDDERESLVGTVPLLWAFRSCTCDSRKSRIAPRWTTAISLSRTGPTASYFGKSAP